MREQFNVYVYIHTFFQTIFNAEMLSKTQTNKQVNECNMIPNMIVFIVFVKQNFLYKIL